jgi:hypothetical protein
LGSRWLHGNGKVEERYSDVEVENVFYMLSVALPGGLTFFSKKK